MEMEQQRRQPHVLMVPFPTQGHITPMLNLAQLLCHAGIHVTFLSTEHNHRRLTQRQTLSARFPTLRFESIPDGLPPDDPRSVSGASLMELIYSLRSSTKPLFRDLLVSLRKKDEESTTTPRPPLSCVLTDDLMSFAIDVAAGMGIPVMALRVISACGTWAYACIPDLIRQGHLPFADEDMDQKFKYIPGMEDLMRGRDLPTYFRMATNNPSFRIMADEAEALTRVSALILNTFDDLEASMLTRIAARFPKIYPIGPLHGLLKYRVEDDDDLSSTSAVSMYQEDRRCMAWLDSQLSKSVVYVSFGSLAQLTRGDWFELLYGLVNSGKPFLMVVRKDMFLDEQGKNVIPEEVELGVKERGFIVNWAPQEEVLAHDAVGGFMTQCGWNSTLEGIWAGVPMIGWPQLAEQAVTSRWVGEVWKIGIDFKVDKIDRFAVEKTVRALMEDKREETCKSIGRFGTLARRAVSKGGSSYQNLNKLIEDLRKL